MKQVVVERELRSDFEYWARELSVAIDQRKECFAGFQVAQFVTSELPYSILRQISQPSVLNYRSVFHRVEDVSNIAALRASVSKD